jgi:hypothetical protein
MGSAGKGASGASIASLGLTAAGDVMAGYAKQAEYQTKATNYAVEGQTKATNYLLQGQSQATNYLLKGQTDSANYLYEGAAKKAEYGLEASKDEMLADQADRAADFGRLQAGLTDVTLREDLNRTLGNIETIRAAGRVDPSSPTTAARAATPTWRATWAASTVEVAFAYPSAGQEAAPKLGRHAH